MLRSIDCALEVFETTDGYLSAEQRNMLESLNEVRDMLIRMIAEGSLENLIALTTHNSAVNQR